MRLRLLACLLLFPAADCTRTGSGPRLVLLLVVDQSRADYLDRFEPLLSGGLAYLMANAFRFEEARHRHALTVTSPGHAALVTGRHPSRSGMVSNEWYDRARRRWVYSAEDASAAVLGAASEGRSPRNLLVTALPDWIRERYPGSRAFSVSRKDRAAVIAGGKRPDAAYWYDSDTGKMVSSRYYLEAYPAWVDEYRSRLFPDSYLGRSWTPLRAIDPEALREAKIQSTGSRPEFSFPLGERPGRDFYEAFQDTPFVDAYVADFARRLIEHEDLGQDGAVDFLALGFSALDAVGHDWGPSSPQVLDAFLRLDRALGELLEYVDMKVGLDATLIALSSDHGVLTPPESPWAQPGARRMRRKDRACFEGLEEHLVRSFGSRRWLQQGLLLDPEAVARSGFEAARIEQAMASWLESRCDFVERAWTRSEVMAGGTADGYLGLYRNSFHPERGPDLYLQYRQNFLSTLRPPGTTHGSPYRYDTHVPLLLLVPGSSGRRITRPVATVDLAPTLAALLDVPFPRDLDGRDLSGLFTGP